ncbi:MAG: flagellar biosynthetic protein FliO [Gemmatimonadota bacterium]|nr:flagellar biosynthetic protein FliO [Gemmatimonadota bacterium]
MLELAAVSFVLALLAGAVWWVKQHPGWTAAPPHERSLEAVERLRLSPQHTLVVVRAGERLLLVATHPQGCSLLARLAPGRSRRGERVAS